MVCNYHSRENRKKASLSHASFHEIARFLNKNNFHIKITQDTFGRVLFGFGFVFYFLLFHTESRTYKHSNYVKNTDIDCQHLRQKPAEDNSEARNPIKAF